MFRSVRFYSLESPWFDTEQALSEKLAQAAFKPCGPYSERSSGFEPPVGEEHGLARRVSGVDLIRLRSQVRLLPAAAIKEALDVRVAEYRARMQMEPGRRTKRQLKEQTRDELLPKALLKSERTSALYLASEKVLAVGTGSATRAERLVETLRMAFGKLEVRPLEFTRPFDEVLTRTFVGEGPRELVVARECRMRDPKDARSTVRWQNVDLAHSTVQRCLRDGMEITHLAFEHANIMHGMLDGNGVLTKIELLGMDETAANDGDDPLAKLDAEIALFGGALRELIVSLRRALGGATAAATRPAAHTIVGTPAEPAPIETVDELDDAAPALAAT
jgi:recombination associated protein RdgC